LNIEVMSPKKNEPGSARGVVALSRRLRDGR
jgi:hypothetical protein